MEFPFLGVNEMPLAGQVPPLLANFQSRLNTEELG